MASSDTDDISPSSEEDSASSSSSTPTLLFSGEDSRSSGDISTTTSESFGEIPVPAVEEITPVRDRCVGRTDRVTYGFTSVIGRRSEMEDAVALVPGFMSVTCSHVGGCTASGSRTSAKVSPLHFFGVYDGHGGSQVAKYCAERLHEVIVEEWRKREGMKNKGGEEEEWKEKWKEAFKSGFKRADDQVILESGASEMVGSTAVVAVVSACQIILSNCGDSRAILCRRTQTIPLTLDHKPDRLDELSRIEAHGGKVINWNGARVLGVLAMSRSIGDRYMSPFIIPLPDISFITRSDEDECLILASDGLWDVMSNDEVGEVARRLIRQKRRSMLPSHVPPSQLVADHLTKLAFSRNSCDNISIIVVDLKSRKTHPSTTLKGKG